jgi:hypothetical protein
MLRDILITKLKLYTPIGMGSTALSQNSSIHWHLSLSFILPYSPINGDSECKHCHIVEMDLALLSMLMFCFGFGTRLFKQLATLSIVFPHHYLKIPLHMKSFFTPP